MIAKEERLPYEVKPLNDGTGGVQVDFAPQSSGAYIVSIKIGSKHLNDSPYRLTVIREEDMNPLLMLKAQRYDELAQVREGGRGGKGRRKGEGGREGGSGKGEGGERGINSCDFFC